MNNRHDRATARRLAVCLVWLALASCLLLAAPAQAAVNVELTATTKTAFERTKAKAAPQLQTKLANQLSDLNVLGRQAEYWEDKAKATRKRHTDTQAAVRKQTKDIDAARIAKLEQQVKDAKAKYEPLFSAYTALNKRIATSRSLGTKELTAVLRTQADVMQPATQLARSIIREKEQALKDAKAERAKKAERVRGILAEIDPVKVRISAEQSAMKAPRTRIESEWKNFKLAVKNTDPSRTSDSLTYLVADLKLIVAHSRTIDELEQRIVGIVTRAQAQLK